MKLERRLKSYTNTEAYSNLPQTQMTTLTVSMKSNSFSAKNQTLRSYRAYISPT